MRYLVTLSKTQTAEIEVDAKNEEEAVIKAKYKVRPKDWNDDYCTMDAIDVDC